MSYLDELDRELRAAGVRGARRRRILAEVEDHLHESGDVGAFGDARSVAQRFADELATAAARQSAFAAFAGLAPAGVAYAALVLPAQPGPDITAARSLPVGLAAAVLLLLAPQVSLAAGALAVLRAWRLRAFAAAPAAEVRIVRRRVAVAVATGAATLVSLVVYAYEYRDGSPASVLAAAAAVPLLAAARAAWRASGPRSAVAGAAGDLTDDLEPVVRFLPPWLRSPWRLCLAFAAVAAAAALAAGGIDEGPRNAVGEFVAISGGFGLLGRYLGLRRERHCSQGSA